MNAYRPFDPLEALVSERITYTTAVIEPNMSTTTLKQIEKGAEKMGFTMLLLLGAIVAAIFKWETTYTLLFVAFIACLFAYVITAAILHKKIEAYSIVGVIKWEKNSLKIESKINKPTIVIPFTSVKTVKSRLGIQHQLLSKSKSRNRDYTSVIVEFRLNDESIIETELFYMSEYNAIFKAPGTPLTEQLLKSVFNSYVILDKRALERG